VNILFFVGRLVYWLIKKLIRLGLLLLVLYFVAMFILQLVFPLHYREIVDHYAKEYELPPELVMAVIRVESKFDPTITSQKGARGLMQIMPSTGEWIAEKLDYKDFHEDDLFIPEVNIEFGTWYLAHLYYDEFDGNLAATIAAYNGGRGNVRQWLESGKWSGEFEDVSNIPYKETREFVGKVMNDYRVYQWLYWR